VTDQHHNRENKPLNLPEGADIFQEFEEACQKLQGWA